MPESLEAWTQEELIDAIGPASDHVRTLLGELTRRSEGTLQELGSPAVAVALIGRICQGRRRESLIQRRQEKGQVFYSLAPGSEGMVAAALAFSGRIPRRRPRKNTPTDGSRRKVRRQSRASKAQATANSQWATPPEALDPDDSDSLVIPPGAPANFAVELVQFLQRTSNTRYVIVSDGNQTVLEARPARDGHQRSSGGGDREPDRLTKNL